MEIAQTFTIQHWKPRHDKAVALVADDRLSDEAIATELGISRRMLAFWKTDERFRAEVGAQRERIREAILAFGIADRANRVRAQHERWMAAQAVIAARAEANLRRARSYENDKLTFDDYTAAGAETGLLVHTVSYSRDGRREEWAFDAAIYKELREHEKQAAIEVGEWTEKRDVTANVKADVSAKHEFDTGSFADLFGEVAGVAEAGPPAD